MAVPPLVLDIRRPVLHLEVHYPRVLIDMKEARADLTGLNPWPRFAREKAAEARQHALRAIETIARDGDRMARIHLSTNAIAERAKERSRRTKDLNVTSAPKHPVNIVVVPGAVDVTFIPGRVSVAVAGNLLVGANLDTRA